MIAIVALVFVRASAQQPGQLPDEGVLPGGRSATTDPPSEAVLPGTRRAAGADLPGEDQLPGAVAAPTELNPQPPILRLAFDGHTALIRTLDLSDGGRTMVSGGDDKDLHVWRRTDVGRTGWLHRRTIRWPVARGPRGRIYSAKLRGDWVAMAGHGAFGSVGEIRIVDVASGELLQTLVTEDDIGVNILSLAWSPTDTPRLASINQQGRVMDWQADPTTGIWRGKMWVDIDRKTYGDEVAVELEQPIYRGFAAVTFLGSDAVIAPKLNTEFDGEIKAWHLERIDLSSGERTILDQTNHVGHVRSLVASDDGRVLVSADMGAGFGGKVGVWKFKEDGSIGSFEVIQPDKPPLALYLDEGANRLTIGTEIGADQLSSIEIWDLSSSPAQQLTTKNLAGDDAYAIALDAKKKEVIASQGNSIQIHSLDEQGKLDESPPRVLQPPVSTVLNVAFEKGDGYRVAFGWGRDQEGKKTLDGVFDLADSKLLGRGPIDRDDFHPSQRTATRWGPYGPLPGDLFQLYEGNEPRGMLPLERYWHGVPTAAGTVPVPSAGNEDPGEVPATGAVIIGTSGQSNLYVYRADPSDPPKLLRQFRGHWGDVQSVSSSSDGKYLVSGAADSTIAVWNLEGVFTASEMINRWGAEFELESGKLLATNVDEAGPLYFRGVREGDELSLIKWVSKDQKQGRETDPQKIRQNLLDLPFDTQVVFEFLRLSRPGPTFQSYPAWRPLATLFVAKNREWAYWTPAGYYDASFNGHQNFGWQLNHVNVDRPVQYFRAAQFRKMLERPDIMRGLLSAGSLAGAVRNTLTQIGPPPAEGEIVNQIETRPEIRLLSPDPGNTVEGDRLTVRAEITVPTGASLIEPKAFVSGVPAIDRQIVSNDADADVDAVTYQWQFRLPSDPQLQLEILAATESEAVERLLVDLNHRPSDLPRPKPRLHVLAIGVSQYTDPQIQSLDFAAGAAGQITELFRNKAADLYQTTGDALTNTDATRPLWRVFAQSAAEDLSQTVSPDDLVIMYLCGHGLRDRRTNQWYFVTADARYSDLMNDQYDDCIAFSDLAALSQLPCRKLAILDSCHSGAVQPLMRRDDLKSALRFLQDDVVITLTASEGDEEAAEQRETRLGRFTTALVDALSGKAAEVDGDENVSLREVIDYVTQRVTDESEADGMPQHPTASPHYLLRTLQLPLTSR